MFSLGPFATIVWKLRATFSHFHWIAICVCRALCVFSLGCNILFWSGHWLSGGKNLLERNTPTENPCAIHWASGIGSYQKGLHQNCAARTLSHHFDRTCHPKPEGRLNVLTGLLSVVNRKGQQSVISPETNRKIRWVAHLQRVRHCPCAHVSVGKP